MIDREADIEINGIKIFESTNEVLKKGEWIKLKPKEMGVLMTLARQKGETVSRDYLLESVWGSDFQNDLGLTQAVSVLRRLFEEDRNDPKVIRTIPKKGYQLVAGDHEATVRIDTYFSSLFTQMKSNKLMTLVIILLILLILLLGSLIIWKPKIIRKREIRGMEENQSILLTEPCTFA